jgi:pterin-4a-carbinolamine dehydratase
MSTDSVAERWYRIALNWGSTVIRIDQFQGHSYCLSTNSNRTCQYLFLWSCCNNCHWYFKIARYYDEVRKCFATTVSMCSEELDHHTTLPNKPEPSSVTVTAFDKGILNCMEIQYCRLLWGVTVGRTYCFEQFDESTVWNVFHIFCKLGYTRLIH